MYACNMYGCIIYIFLKYIHVYIPFPEAAPSVASPKEDDAEVWGFCHCAFAALRRRSLYVYICISF